MKEIGPAREFSPQRAEEAIGRVSFSGRGKLFYREAPKPGTPPVNRAGKINHAATADLQNHKPGVFVSDDSQDKRYVGGRFNHASVQQEKKEVTPARPADAWQTICEKLTRNGTHGQQNRLRQILDGAIADGKSYREAHSLLQAELARLQRG